ncbi:MAG: ATP-binding protein [Candidatus Zixiibacteriota bacterium]
MTGVESPFSPGKPVASDLFVGREVEIAEIGRFLRQSAQGRNENVFIGGERGFGKSSLALLCTGYAQNELGFSAAYCQLTAASSADEACTLIAQKLLAQMPKSLAERARGVFERYIESVSLGLPGTGVQVRFRADATLRNDLKLSFPELIRESYARLQPEVRGLMVVLDDLNGVARDFGFANFLKGWVDGMVTSGLPAMPLMIVLVGTQEKMQELSTNQPSVGRIFRPIILGRVADSVVDSFFERAFASVNVTVTPEASAVLRYFSGGVPSVMHEIGDATFWINRDTVVDEDDAFAGVWKAAEVVGLKYVEPQVVKRIRSKSYREIIRKIAEFPGGPFRRQNLLRAASDEDRTRVDNLLRKLEELGVIRKTDKSGEYEFIHTLHKLYFRLLSGHYPSPKTRH